MRFRKGVSTEDSVLKGHDTTLTHRQYYKISYIMLCKYIYEHSIIIDTI